MSDRRQLAAKNKTLAWVGAGVVHLIIIGAVLISYTKKHESIEAFDAEKIDLVKASVIDESDIKDQQERLKNIDREKERQRKEKERKEKQRLDDLKKQQLQKEKELQQIEDKKQQEKKAAAELERKRKQIALEKQREEERAKKALEQRLKEEEARERKAAQQRELLRRLEQEEKQRKENLQRMMEEEERQRLNQMLIEEEQRRMRQEADRRAKERTGTIMNIYSERIRRAVKAKWRVDPGTERWRKARLNIKLTPLGEVTSVRVIESSGLPSFDKSVETAVFAASPLPIPSSEEDAAAHRAFQDINFPFNLDN